jgi:hypothetical protein
MLMYADAVVTGLSMQINGNDGNYCPSLVDVFVGDLPAELKKVRTFARVCSRLLTDAHVCSRMLTYAHVC